MALARSRVDQRVATSDGGFSVTVFSITAASIPRVIFRGRPERGRSCSIPAMPLARWRRVQVIAVPRAALTDSAIPRLLSPSEAASTI